MMSSSSDLIPISCVAHRYYLYDLDHVKQCREQHGMLGVFVGTLPQYSQQNIFLGLPQELMAEEARLLVEIGAAYIADGVQSHTDRLKNLSRYDRHRYKRALHRRGYDLAKEDNIRAEENTRRALETMSPAKRERVEAKLVEKTKLAGSQSNTTSIDANEDGPFFSDSQRSPCCAPTSTDTLTLSSFTLMRPRLITPTTSSPPLFSPPRHFERSMIRPNTKSNSLSLMMYAESTDESDFNLPPVPSLPAYALYKNLHSLSYFQSPGLRFGCQFCVYPGDPLRFHSHFLARGYGWDDEIDLIGLVGGGRLGTGVKKGFLIGGPVKNAESEREDDANNSGDGVKIFCIEWAGM